MKKIKEELIENYKETTKWYQILKILFVLVFTITLLLDRILVFDSNIFANIHQIYFSRANWNDILFFGISFILLYIGITILEIIFKKMENKICKQEKKGKKRIAIYFLIFVLLLLAWLPYILSAFPGGIYGDTGVSINQSIGIDELDNHHPLLYTLSIKGAIHLFGGSVQLGMSLITILQIILMASVFSYLVYWLYKRDFAKGYIILTALFFMFFKLIPLYVMSNWKDSIFSVALLAYIINLMEIIYQNGENLRKNTEIFKYIISMFFVSFLRNNGLYIILGVTIVLVTIYRKQIRTHLKKFTITAFISILIFYVIQGPIYDKLGVNTETVEGLGIPLQQICYVVAKDGKITQEQEEFINQICPIEVIKEKFTPFIVDSIKWNENFKGDFLKNNKLKFIKVWIEIFLQNPKEYVAEYLFNTLGYWDVNKITNNSYVQYQNWNNEQPFAGVNQIDYIKELTGKSILDELGKVRLISAAIWAWILLLSMLLTIKRKRYRNLIILLPALFNWATIMIATPIAFTLRYVYILVLVVPLDILIPMMPEKREKLGGKYENSNIDTML